MSYEQAQSEVAKKYDFDKWDECIAEAYMNNEFRVMYDTDPHKLFMEVAELYARAKHDEACEAQKAKCVQQLPYPYRQLAFNILHQLIADAPKPEFKP